MDGDQFLWQLLNEFGWGMYDLKTDFCFLFYNIKAYPITTFLKVDF